MKIEACVLVFIYLCMCVFFLFMYQFLCEIYNVGLIFINIRVILQK